MSINPIEKRNTSRYEMANIENQLVLPQVNLLSNLTEIQKSTKNTYHGNRAKLTKGDGEHSCRRI